jgi:Holliday junction DNA helicase RuvB
MFDGYIGQTQAVNRLTLAITAAQQRHRRLDHILLTGPRGHGKSRLAAEVAKEMGTQLITVSGKLTLQDGRALLRKMRNGDLLFIDEIHKVVDGGKASSEWLLHLLQDQQLVTTSGIQQVPDITIIGATTDAAVLPDPLVDRFPVQIRLAPYTPLEAACISKTMGYIVDPLPRLTYEQDWELAWGAACNPRTIRAILYTLRDLASRYDPAAFTQDNWDVKEALDLMGLTWEGLDRLAQDYLRILLRDFSGGPVGAATMADRLSEVNLTRTEQLLISKGYLVKTRLGRSLTDTGINRAQQLLCVPA